MNNEQRKLVADCCKIVGLGKLAYFGHLALSNGQIEKFIVCLVISAGIIYAGFIILGTIERERK